MRILVISDTHIPVITDTLPSIIETEVKKSDCCFHAGDWISLEVFEKLSGQIKTYAVSGNMDDENVKKRLPEKLILDIEKVKIGLTHGKGAPDKVADYVNELFKEQKKNIDIFVFGHSHLPVDKEIGGKIYFNPGSLTDTIFTPYRSYGILEIKGKTIKRRIVKIG